MEHVVSVILAGGEGTRLFPLTQYRCKPDVRFAGRYRLIDIPISNSLHSKIQEIFILSQHFTDSLHGHIETTYPSQPHTFHFLTPSEKAGIKNLYKGTADAVRQNLAQILQSTTEYVLILAGDQLYHMNYHEIVDFAKQEDADLVIAALPVDEAEAKRMGVLKIDPSSHVIDFYEKPSDRKTLNDFFDRAAQKYLGSMGIYVFKKKALESLLNEAGDDFGKHMIPSQVKKGKTSAFCYTGYWEDIGTIRAYYYANLSLTHPHNWMHDNNMDHRLFTPHHNIATPFFKNSMIRDSLINQGSHIEAKEITHSVIGMMTSIGENTIVRDSIIIGDHSSDHAVTIGKNCVIEKAIIDSDVCIGNNVRLLNQNQVQKYDGNGIYIRDGIIIVTANTRLPDGFLL